ncbi:mannosyltransferase [Salpingoeca rosetta]|uniref:Mannosyltransferase n=1 Tax=Salpingoeca rosetta (strain ATCC 50818 / BSB-021) TaxID=946362 RepID=F2U5J9_SALR5|nr:mannosyltransferase [Salpingoeca rosetta]EGD83215.1 mannosyltransferase [Salpingoeca rosetta]|eukprot:XP_004995579.1 mannosyltransferase [Salpingoeca rosetta]
MMRRTMLVVVGVVAVALAIAATANASVPKGYEVVTCGTALKLEHVATSYRLHSQEVAYGTGSGQQSVTIKSEGQDMNDLWQIAGASGKECRRGQKIKCGSTIRLFHVGSQKWLHSHNFQSPLSHNQEVSAFGDHSQSDTGDNWKVECSGTYWKRDDTVRFRHADTKMYLHSTGRHQFNRPISGQREVCAYAKSSNLNQWRAAEGYFLKYMPKNAN